MTDDMVRPYLRIVRSLARRYARRGRGSFDDLFQVGAVGLVRAFRAYNPDRGVTFATFAYHYVAGEIRHYLRDDHHPMHRSRRVQAESMLIDHVTFALQQRLGRHPTVLEVGREAGMSNETIARIRTERDRASVRHLSDLAETPTGRAELVLADRDPVPGIPVEDRLLLMRAMNALPELERQVVYYLFFLDLSQSEAAKRLGVSQRHVSRLLSGAVRDLAAGLRANGVAPVSRSLAR